MRGGSFNKNSFYLEERKRGKNRLQLIMIKQQNGGLTLQQELGHTYLFYSKAEINFLIPRRKKRLKDLTLFRLTLRELEQIEFRVINNKTSKQRGKKTWKVSFLETFFIEILALLVCFLSSRLSELVNPVWSSPAEKLIFFCHLRRIKK